MAKINIKQLFKELTPAIIKSQRNLAFGTAVSIFKPKKQSLLEYFNQHPVTQEIEAAQNTTEPISISNSSGLLGGRGNLFTFIGFNLGRKPIDEVRNILNTIRVINKPTNRADNRFIYFNFPIKIPTDDEIENVSRMDWESGVSWVRGIERGISGFSNYMYWKRLPQSRSTGAVQVQNTLRGGDFRTTDYLFKRLAEFRRVNRKII